LYYNTPISIPANPVVGLRLTEPKGMETRLRFGITLRCALLTLVPFDKKTLRTFPRSPRSPRKRVFKVREKSFRF
jgi:hypothetical protein